MQIKFPLMSKFHDARLPLEGFFIIIGARFSACSTGTNILEDTMELTAYSLSMVFAGIILTGIISWLWWRSRLAVLQSRNEANEADIVRLNADLGAREAIVNELLAQKSKFEGESQRIPRLEMELDVSREENAKLREMIASNNKERESTSEKLQWIDRAQEHLRETFQALSGQILAGNTDEFMKRARETLDSMLTQVRGDWSTHKAEIKNLVIPLETSLETLGTHVRELEKKRESSYGALSEQLAQLTRSHSELQTTTSTLAQALKSHTVRGKWGEMQLRRIVEMAGMVEHVDFIEQAATDEGRPDMVIYLPQEGILPVDAKAPLDAYLEAIEAASEDVRRRKLADHVRAIKSRITDLGKKSYWQQFGGSLEFVVMFIPNDACLNAAFEQDPGLLQYAMESRILLATPTSLIGLLKTVAYGWSQIHITENARNIALQGKELYSRLLKFFEHIFKTGKALDGAVKSYNDAVGSLESRLLPAAGKFKELVNASEEIQEPEAIERTARKPVKKDDEDDGGDGMVEL